MPNPPELVAIAAHTQNRVIGKDGGMPWHLPADFAHFRALSRGKPNIMGRKVWDSLGGQPLRERENIVLTRNPDFQAPGATVAHSPEEALNLAGNAPEIAIIGGEEIYRLYWNRLTRLEVTLMPAELDGDRWAVLADLVQTRIVVLSDAWDLIRFLVVDESEFVVDPGSAAKNLKADAREVVDAAAAALESVPEWSTPAIEAALSGALVDELGLKPRKAYGPVRVAVTGSHISPPLFESLELLGREVTLARLQAAPIAE